jgi:hypothetical protein
MEPLTLFSIINGYCVVPLGRQQEGAHQCELLLPQDMIFCEPLLYSGDATNAEKEDWEMRLMERKNALEEERSKLTAAAIELGKERGSLAVCLSTLSRLLPILFARTNDRVP